MKTKKERIIDLLPILNDTRIAREVGCSKQYVHVIRNLCGIKSPLKGKHCSPMSEEQLALAIDLLTHHADKFTVSQVAEQVGVSLSVLELVKQEYKIKKAHPLKCKYSKQDMLLLFEKHSGNKTAMAFELGIKIPNMYRLLKQYGIGKGTGQMFAVRDGKYSAANHMWLHKLRAGESTEIHMESQLIGKVINNYNASGRLLAKYNRLGPSHYMVTIEDRLKPVDN